MLIAGKIPAWVTRAGLFGCNWMPGWAYGYSRPLTTLDGEGYGDQVYGIEQLELVLLIAEGLP